MKKRKGKFGWQVLPPFPAQKTGFLIFKGPPPPHALQTFRYREQVNTLATVLIVL